MFEISEYLSNLYSALKEKDAAKVEEIGTFTETDDQYDYESHDLKEIELEVASYISSGDDSHRNRAMILIDEFDVERKIDSHSADY